MGMDNIRKFFDVRVTNIQPVHLHDTQENIRKREKIEFDILDMNAKFKAALDQKTTLENTMNAV